MMTGLVLTSLYLAAGVREIDRMAIEDRGIPGITLMRRAAQACVDAMLKRWPAPGHVGVLCGSGNNAGDGFIIAGLLAARGIEVSVSIVGREPAPGTDAGRAYQFCQENEVPELESPVLIGRADLIVDALLGTGIKGEVRPEYVSVIEQVNAAPMPVLAVDVPSGLCSDTGVVLGAAIRAEVTVTFIARKLGTMTNEGPEYCGDLELATLEVPQDILEGVEAAAELLDYDSLIRNLPRRKKNSHKVSHGHLLVIGGDHGMAGAVSLASEAALMAGAGMVTVATRHENCAAIVARRPEVMARGVESASELIPLMAKASAIVLGPGLGRSKWSQTMYRAALECDLPLIVDADGLNILAENPLKRDNWVLTPHPGEASRMLGHGVQENRLQSVMEIQARYGGVCLLKGSGTIIATTSGAKLCPYGNPGMAVAGMGDLLAGIIGSLHVQGLDADLSTLLGAVVHSLSADKCVEAQGERGLLAAELLAGVRSLLNRR